MREEEFRVILKSGQRQCKRCGIPHSDRRFKHCIECRKELKGESLTVEPRATPESAYGFSLMRRVGLNRVLASMNNRSTMEILDMWISGSGLTRPERTR